MPVSPSLNDTRLENQGRDTWQSVCYIYFRRPGREGLLKDAFAVSSAAGGAHSASI